MVPLSIKRCVLSLSMAVPLFFGCSGPAPLLQASTAGRSDASKVVAYHAGSWVRSDAASKDLLYAGSWVTDDVYIFDKSGNQLGELTGFNEPDGMCVDKRGDVYITNYGSGSLVEYRHGGAAPIKTFSPGGYPSGCSVDQNGDVAVNSLSNPANVTVYAQGNPSYGTPYQNLACTTQLPMGYDDQGNLIGLGSNGQRLSICAVLSGAKSEIALSYSGFSIHLPGATMWDGKYIALTDSEVNSKFETGIIEVRLVGATLLFHRETFLTSSDNYATLPQPFIAGDHNTPVNRRRGTIVIGPTASSSYYELGFWQYPQGGSPTRAIPLGEDRIWGEAVSLARN